MLCLDTYALIEINNGNPRFAGLMEHDFVITNLTMAEFYADIYRKYNEKTADFWHRKLSPFCKAVPRDILIKATKFRIDNSKRNLSFFDSAGYVYSLENSMKFVTGDKEFEKREGVLFLK
ncbi:PIN domain-containing protein [Candidatus Woesearchaeota archaeon]|nr:PIN domain-containing protein [Candidatus Woesearchaeota archaeon]